MTIQQLEQQIQEVESAIQAYTVEMDSKKIQINGTFGKLGSKWSALYSPRLLTQVTITGQLVLLMLIERLEQADIEVVSANTDGVLSRCPVSKYEDVCRIIKEIESLTGFSTEETRYRSYHARDVNSYIGVKTNGEVKTKGAFANPWEKPGSNIFKLHKNPTNAICVEAAIALLKDGTPIRETIHACKDIRKFVTVRNVSGGAKKDDIYLGKAIRFYMAKDAKGDIQYSKRKAKVSKSDGAKPLMTLPDTLPGDINYQWYLAETQALLIDLGYGQATLW